MCPSTSKADDVTQLTITNAAAAGVSYLDNANAFEEPLAVAEVSKLRYDQFRACDIITWHLNQTLASADLSPLRMLIHGEGDTGKSKVIQTTTKGQQDTC